MALKLSRTLFAALVAWMLGSPSTSQTGSLFLSGPTSSPAPVYTLCLRAAEKAAAAVGVPVDVLKALTLTETGRSAEGRMQPWPWAVNAGGTGYWFATRAEAEDFVQRKLRSGHRNLDLGCFQLNFRWHGEAFSTIQQMMSPDENALYAARFLRSLFAESGDWSSAAGAYHSRNARFSAPYRVRFQRILERLPQSTSTERLPEPGVSSKGSELLSRNLPLVILQQPGQPLIPGF